MSTMPAAPEPGTLTTPCAPTVTFRAPYIPRHRKPMSPLTRDLNDAWVAKWVKQGFGREHVSRHRLGDLPRHVTCSSVVTGTDTTGYTCFVCHSHLDDAEVAR